MTYQPLYATINDGFNERTSTSRRGKVDHIRVWVNSQLGEVCSLVVRGGEQLTTESENRLEECALKIEGFKKAANHKKVMEWLHKRDAAQAEHDTLKEREKIYLTLYLKEETQDKTLFSLNGQVNIPSEILFQFLDAYEENPALIKQMFKAAEELKALETKSSE